MGIPTAVHVTHSFKHLLFAEAKASKVPNMGVWETPHPVVGKTKEVLRKEIEKVFDDIIRSFLTMRETKAIDTAVVKETEKIIIEGNDYFDVFSEYIINNLNLLFP